MRWYEAALNSPTIWRTIWLFFYAGYGILFPWLITLGIRTAHQLSVKKSFLISLIGLSTFQLILLVFIR